MAPMILRCQFLCLIFFFAFSSPSLANPLQAPNAKSKANVAITTHSIRVVASIKPIHSLLSHLMLGIATPQLLLDNNQSPHHFSLRPSQRRLLADADIIFWIGDALESFLPSVLNALPKSVQQQSLHGNTQLQLLETRLIDNAESAHHGHGHGLIDPHIWLSVDNAITMSKQMADRLMQIDTANSKAYQQNLSSLLQQLNELKLQLQKSSTNNFKPFLVYHDAFQYFEASLKIKPLAAISNDDEHPPGVRRLSQLTNLLKNQPVSCLIYNNQDLPAIAQQLIKPYEIKTIYAEALGQSLVAGKDLYFDLINGLLTAYQRCQ